MAIVSSPLFDSISGKCGGVVFCKYRGKIVMKALPLKKKNRKPTENQQVQQDLFKGVRARRRLIERDQAELAKYAARCPSDINIHNFITSELLLEPGTTKTQG
jgi:hypothetical protein